MASIRRLPTAAYKFKFRYNDCFLEMFPQMARSRIEQVLRQTGSVSIAVEALLEANRTERAAIAPQEPADELNDASSSSDDSSSTSGSLTNLANDAAGDIGDAPLTSAGSEIGEPLKLFTSKNTNITAAYGQMFATQRRRVSFILYRASFDVRRF